MSFSVARVSILRLGEESLIVEDLTEHLSKEEAVALLESDTLPVKIVRS